MGFIRKSAAFSDKVFNIAVMMYKVLRECILTFFSIQKLFESLSFSKNGVLFLCG